jgi:hypothetical protein
LAGTLENCRAGTRDLRGLTRFFNHVDGQCRGTLSPHIFQVPL